MQLLHWVGSIISTQEWRLSRKRDLSAMKIEYVEEQWSDLQALNRRCAEYCEDVERIMLVLGLDNNKLVTNENWMSVVKDFTLILARLKVLKTKCEVLLGSITALTGIAGNRQSLGEAKRSFREAKNVKLLTLIGIIFVPLVFICGLFSMNDRYLPGSGQFWVYWASAAPLVVAVFLGAIVSSLGYCDEARTWSVRNIWQAEKRRNEREARAIDDFRRIDGIWRRDG
jgi:hypothetical protein